VVTLVLVHLGLQSAQVGSSFICKNPAKSHKIHRTLGQASFGWGELLRQRAQFVGFSLHVTTTLAHRPKSSPLSVTII
jgi:hypothetical protein